MKKLLFASLLLVFALALTGCASEAPPTAEPNESPQAENEANAETGSTEGISGRYASLIPFDTLESFLENIQRDSLPDGYHGTATFDLSENKESLMFPTQKREIYPLERIEYDTMTGNYFFVHLLDGELSDYRIRSSFEFANYSIYSSIHEYARSRAERAMVNFKFFEVIDDKYLFAKAEDERWISLTWLDGDRLFDFGIENWEGRTVDRERFFEIFENFRFVDFATMEQEVLGQEVAE